MQNYDWPGNIRELKNYVRRAVLFCRTQELTPNDILPHMRGAILRREARCWETEQRSEAASNDSLIYRVAASEKTMIQEALSQYGHNRTATAKALGLSRAGLYKKLRKYGLLDRLV